MVQLKGDKKGKTERQKQTSFGNAVDDVSVSSKRFGEITSDTEVLGGSEHEICKSRETNAE